MMYIRGATGNTDRSCILKSDAPPLGRLRYLIFADMAMAGADPCAFATLLTRLGLTTDEIADLELREPLSSEIAEYAMSLGGSREAVMDAASVVLRWHIQDLDREIEMLIFHRCLLKRKLSAIRRLARVICEPGEPRQSI